MNTETMVAGVGDTAQGTPSGFTVSAAFGFFNVIVGLMLVAAFLMFFGGLSGYLTRLGLENRIEGLTRMYWGVTILFVLVVLIGVVHYLQFHPIVVFAIIGILVVGLIGWAVVMEVFAGGEEKKEAK